MRRGLILQTHQSLGKIRGGGFFAARVLLPSTVRSVKGARGIRLKRKFWKGLI